ncbi:Ubiquitin-protein ligase E3B [Taenia solium]|eukprot:TsM_000392100 transcript=TsM_000392100 gene=TsM_000392100
MFAEVKPNVKDFVEKQKRDREQRKSERGRRNAALCIQRYWRGYKSRKHLNEVLRADCHRFIESTRSENCEGASYPAVSLLNLINKMKHGFKLDADRECSYLSLIQNRDYLILWISQTRWILSVCVEYFAVLNPANEADSNMMNVLLSFVLTMTNCNQWKILRDSKMKPGLMAITDSFIKDLLAHGLYPALKQLLLKGLALHLPVLTQISLTGIFSLAVRPLLLCDFSPECISLFVVHILSVPGFVLHLNSLANEAYDVVVREKLCSRVVTYLYESLPDQSILDCGLEGSYALCLIGIRKGLLSIVLSRLLDLLGGYVGQKRSNLTCWHPILGWFSKPLDNYLQASAPHVASQLRLLWHSRMVRLLFADLYQQEGLGESEQTNTPAVPSTSTSVNLARSPRFKFTEHTIGERKAVEGLIPVNPPSFVSRRYGRGFSDRFGLSAFLRQLKNRIPVRKGDLGGGSVTGTSLKYHHHWPRESGTPGPENLPNSIKVVCMLYCFTIGSLKEIRNDILAGQLSHRFADNFPVSSHAFQFLKIPFLLPLSFPQTECKRE